MNTPAQGPFQRRTFLKGLGALVPLTLSASAPSRMLPGGTANAGPTSGKVTFVYYGDAEMKKAYDRLFEGFRKQYPDITLEAQGISGATWADFLNTVSTRLAGGQQIDVLQVATEGQQLFAARDLLEPLDDLVARDQATVDAYYADTPPQLRKWLNTYGSPDGRTYYMPTGYNTMAMHVNTSVFNKAGVGHPSEEWTWEDFRAAGKQIKERSGAYLSTAGSGYFVDVMPWLVTNGASTMNADWTASTYNSPEAIEALSFVRSLVVDGLTPEPGGTFDPATQMSQGNLATFGGGRWPTPALQRLNIVDDVQLVRWPNNAGPATVVGWEGWPILKGSKSKEAAWTFIKYLMTEEYAQAIIKDGASFVPARLSVATSKAFLENAPQNTELLSSHLDTAVPLPAPQRSTECQKLIEEAWLQGITGSKDPETALTEANEKLQELLS